MRTDYASLKNLPSDADGMRAHLYTGDRGGSSKDEAAFTAAGDMLRETYMPPAQRAALFKAVGTIPGVDVIETAEDAAGRKGVGVGRAGLDGVRQDLIFDPKTYELLGERGIVVDENAAKSPAGSLVASTAQLSVTVADEAPGPVQGHERRHHRLRRLIRSRTMASPAEADRPRTASPLRLTVRGR